MSLGTISASIRLNTQQFDKALSASVNRLQGVSRQFSDVGRSLSLGLTAPIALLGTSILKTAGNFQSAMNTVQVLTGATADEFARLQQTARGLGATTQFSATQAAEGLQFLARAGFDVNQSLAAIEPSLNLAAAANVSLGRSADIVSNILAQFRLPAEQAGRAVDVLAKAANSSNQTVDQLAEAMKFLGPTAAALGVDLEDASASVAVLANAGLQGSIGTRALGTALTKLAAPGDKAKKILKDIGVSAFDNQENFVGLTSLIAQLGDAYQNLSQQEQLAASQALFGAEAFQEINVLLSAGSGEIQRYSNLLRNSTGSAAEIAAAKMKGFNGAIKRLQSAFEELQLAIAESGLLDFAQKLVVQLTALVSQFSQLSPEAKALATQVALIAAAIGPTLLAFGKLAAILPAVATGFRSLSVALGLLTSPVVLVVGAIALIGLTLKSIYDSVQTFQDQIDSLVSSMQGPLLVAIGSVINKAEKMAKAFGLDFDIKGALADAGEEIDELIGKARRPAEEFGDAFAENVKSTIGFLKDVGAALIPDDLLSKVNEITTGISNAFAGIDGKSLGFGDATDQVDKFIDRLPTESDVEPGLAAFNKLKETIIKPVPVPQVDSSEFDESMRDIVDRTNAVVGSLRTGVENAFAGLGEALGAAIANPGNGLEVFLNGILGTVANFAKQFGKQLIAIGIAREAFTNIGSVTGGVGAIIAGTALVVLGSALQNVLQNQSQASLARGTDFIPKDGLYTLHKGEKVVPARFNKDKYTSGGAPTLVSGELRARGSELIALISNARREEALAYG